MWMVLRIRPRERWLALAVGLGLLWQLTNLSYPGWLIRNLAAVATTTRLVPIYSVERTEKVLSLSFDAAWGADYTDDILAILHRHQVRATFFLVGFWVEKYPEVAKRIAAAGHEIGNHSSTHPNLVPLTVEQIALEVSRTHDILKETTGLTPRLFRPPFGAYSNRVLETLTALGYHTIQWSIDSLDWRKEATPQSIVTRVTARAHPGAIVLFHNNATYTPEALEPILTHLREQGYSFVPIGDLLLADNWYIDPTTGQQRRKAQGSR
ncbi:MAG: Peptidoglycan-N-acetylmuramic acid deacetylase PdaA [Firmicutes bacterium]|nr:Peptidoglycan-N-acetylmuramic acid deacetylase PdaA [candidate division NPL-UPA2 bacterium]